MISKNMTTQSIKISIFICAIDEYEIEQVIDVILSTCDHALLEEINIIYSKKSPANYVLFLQSLIKKTDDIPIRPILQPIDGLGEAVFYGYSISKGTHIIGTVADMQLSPFDISEMIARAQKKPDVIITTSRRLRKNGFGKRYSKMKLLLNTLFNFSAHVLMHSSQTDITYPYQCMPAHCFRQYHFFRNHSGIMLEISFLPEMTGIAFEEIPSVLSSRQSGKSHSGFRYYFNLFICYIKLLIKRKLAKT